MLLMMLAVAVWAAPSARSTHDGRSNACCATSETDVRIGDFVAQVGDLEVGKVLILNRFATASEKSTPQLLRSHLPFSSPLSFTFYLWATGRWAQS